MIKANELRVDNFVIYKIDGKNEVCQIEGLTKEYVELRVADPLDFLEDEIPIERCHPIELTPEWLDRSGLVEKESYMPGELKFTVEGNFSIEAIDEGKLKFYLPFNKSIEIKYLHQLQNLYLDLTGEELNVKL
jgi:hypothetical protein